MYPCRARSVGGQCPAAGHAAEEFGDLAVAQAAVVAGNALRQQHAEAALPEARGRQLEQPAVLEHAAGETRPRRRRSARARLRPRGRSHRPAPRGPRRPARRGCDRPSAQHSSSGAQSIRSTPCGIRVRSAARGSRCTGRAQASSHIGPWPSKLVSATPSTIAASASNTRPAALDRGALMPRSHAARTIGSGIGDRALHARLPAQRRGAAPGRAAGLVAAGQPEAAQARAPLPGARRGRRTPRRPTACRRHRSPRRPRRTRSPARRHRARRPARRRARGGAARCCTARRATAPSAWSCSRGARRTASVAPARRTGAAGRAPPARTPVRCAACPCRRCAARRRCAGPRRAPR